MLKLSLRARVLAGMAVIVVALAVVAFIVTATTRTYLIDQLDTRLAAAGGFDRGSPQPMPERPPGGFDPDGPSNRPSDVYVGVIGADGQLVAYFGDDLSGEERAVPDVDAEQVAAGVVSDEPFTTGAVGDSDLRYRARAREADDGDVVITALPLTEVEDTMARLVTVELVVTAVIVAVLGLVTWSIVRLGIRPIKQMTLAATVLVGGGAGIVSSQSTDDTTTPAAPEDATTDGPTRPEGSADREGCGDGAGGRGPGGAAPTEAPATSTDEPGSSLVSP